MCCGGVYVLLACLLLSLPGVQCGGSVTYTTTQVCFLKGASGFLPCKYKHSSIGDYWGGEWYKENSGVVKKHSDSNYPSCSLEIDRITDRHAGVYQFRFYTFWLRSWITGAHGITLSVTDLTVKEIHGAKSSQATVTCSASCNLDSSRGYILGSGRGYIWYKNGERLPGITTSSIQVSEKAYYSCALPGYDAQRSPAVCAPHYKCTHSPPEYSESKDDGNTVSPKDTTEALSREDVSSFTAVIPKDTLAYSPEDGSDFTAVSPTEGLSPEDGTGAEERSHVSVSAHNQYGSQYSPNVEVIFPEQDSGGASVILPVVITSSIVILIFLVVLGVVQCRRNNLGNSSNERTGNSTTQAVQSCSNDDTYAALNPSSLTPGSEYDTLQAVHPVSNDDTCTALDPSSRLPQSEYDTLQAVRSEGATYMPLQRTAEDSVYETLQGRETHMELKDLGMKRQY